MMPISTRVVIAMSGGVDSSVAAALLREQGYAVVGIMLRLWSEPGKEKDNRCCTPDAMAIARRVAARLDIPFYVIDAQEIFYTTVVKSFIAGYAKNTTPNPCLICNQLVRWNFLLQHGLSLGARYLATGHYVRLRRDDVQGIQLLRAIDLAKDQSYVLHRLNQFQLDHTLFPLGHITKPQVREIAQKLNLPAAERPESQDLCFLGNLDYRDFLLRYSPEVYNPGPIISKQGCLMGTHSGLAFYTIGQRKGLNISSPHPLYVLDKDAANNTLIVGSLNEQGKSELIAKEIHWVSGYAPQMPIRAQVKIRYKARSEWAEINICNENELTFRFDQPLRDITPGQSAVIYQDELCLGGGIIS